MTMHIRNKIEDNYVNYAVVSARQIPINSISRLMLFIDSEFSVLGLNNLRFSNVGFNNLRVLNPSHGFWQLFKLRI